MSTVTRDPNSIGVEITPSSRWLCTLNYQYTDGRRDMFFDGITFATVPVQLESYQFLNSVVQYEVIKNQLTFFTSAMNLLNEDFTESVGYTTRGRNFRIGINLTL